MGMSLICWLIYKIVYLQGSAWLDWRAVVPEAPKQCLGLKLAGFIAILQPDQMIVL